MGETIDHCFQNTRLFFLLFFLLFFKNFRGQKSFLGAPPCPLVAESQFTFEMAFLEHFELIFYHKHSRALLCLQEKGVEQSIQVLDIIRTVSKLRTRVNLVFYFLQHEEFFHENIQNESKRRLLLT